MNSVDLSKAKSGDVAHYRSGDTGEIESITEKANGHFNLKFKRNNLGILSPWRSDGRLAGGGACIFDIVKVTTL